MHFVKSILLLLSGIVIGIAFVFACGDDWLHDGDAPAAAPTPVAAAAGAVCDCPAAEPPLAGRFVVVSAAKNLSPNGGRGFESVMCPTNSQLISGSCVVDNATTLFNVTLEQSGFYQGAPTGWNCAFRNNEMMYTVPFRVSAICLKPAP